MVSENDIDKSTKNCKNKKPPVRLSSLENASRYDPADNSAVKIKNVYKGLLLSVVLFT